MTAKELENNIKKTKEFIEIWNKFHLIFKNTISANHLSENKEKEFLSVKSLVNSRYEDLMDSLGAKPLERFTMNASIYNILTFGKISIMSDERLNKIAKDWDESYKFLISLLGRLENKKKNVKGFSKFVFIIKEKLLSFNNSN